MKRVLAAVSAIALAAIGIAGCGSSDAEQPESEPVAAAPAEEEEVVEELAEEEPALEQTVPEACLALAGPIQDASVAIADAGEQTANDPQAAVDAWTALAEAFTEYAGSVENTEVKPIADQLAKDSSALRDEIETVFLKNDVSRMAEYTASLQAFSDSYQSLVTLCGPESE